MKKALLIVDVQEGFFNDHNRWIIPNIQRTIREGEYELIIEATFHAEKGSLWDTQVNWTFPLSPTITEIKELLPSNALSLIKTTKSAFKGDKDVTAALHAAVIEEVHVVGLDTNDCVFATAQESFDLGFRTYVIEDCTESSEGAKYRDAGLLILRDLGMLR